MIRRYVLATGAVVLLVVGVLLGLTVYLGLHYGETSDDRARIGTLAEALTPTADGLQFDTTQTPAQWMQGYAWAMVLDEDGTVIWQYDLPQNLNKHYTASEIASFSRWYLDDWPVFCWTATRCMRTISPSTPKSCFILRKVCAAAAERTLCTEQRPRKHWHSR